jgi:hypothetical protein
MLLELGDHFAEKKDIKLIDFDEDAATRPDKSSIFSLQDTVIWNHRILLCV